MTVRDLIERLEMFDEDAQVKIGMMQNYGSDFAMNIVDNVDEFNIRSFHGKDYRAVVLTQGNQCGTVDYLGDDDFEDDFDDEE